TLNQHSTRHQPKKLKLRIKISRRPKYTPLFFLKPGSNKEIHVHTKRTKIAVVPRKIRLARGDGAIVVASRAKRLSSVEQRGCVAHLGGAVERFDRFTEESAGDLRLSKTDPRGGRVEPDCGLPQVLGKIR